MMPTAINHRNGLFRPPAPQPRLTPHGVLGILRALRSNPIETWTREHYEKPVVLSTSMLGRSAVVCEPAAIRRILIDNVDNYRKDELQKRLLAPALGNGLLTSGGEQWRAQRRRFAPIFTPRMIASFEAAMVEQADLIVARWRPLHEGTRIDVAEEMARTMLRILEQTLFSDGVGREPGEFMRAATHYFDTQGRVDPLDVLGLPDWIPRLGKIRARPALEFFPKAVDAVIAARRQLLATDPAAAPRDVVTALIEGQDDETGQRMSDDEVAANVITFIGAGHETPANALSWSLFLLSFDPAWRLEVEREVDREMTDGRFVSGSLDRFVHTRALIEEAMRLYPPVAIITREAVQGDVLAGVSIEPGTIVVIAPWVIHRHRLLWKDADHFDPARFLPGARDNIDRFAYLPFGAGPRVCIGASFAMQEMIITLATIARHFRLDLAPGHKVEPVHRVTLRPEGGMKMILRPRRDAGRKSGSRARHDEGLSLTG